jgi:hypothetical protein
MIGRPSRQRQRFASLACAEAFALGVEGAREEADVFALRPPSRAGGATVDAGRRHGEHERAVLRAVALRHRAPGELAVEGRRHALILLPRAPGLYPILALELACGLRRGG